MSQTLLVEYQSNTLCMTLNRAEQKNALSYALLEELEKALSNVKQDDCHAVIICSNSHCFSAGADLNDLTGTIDDIKIDVAISNVITNIHALEIPVIALIEGACIGAAVDIALACNMRVATNKAWFQIPATRLGLLYNPDAVQRMSKQYPHEVLVRLLALGERFNASDAIQVGLITYLLEQQGENEKKTAVKQNGINEEHAVNTTKAMLEALYRDEYDPTYWHAIRKQILASPERRAAIEREKNK